MTQNAVDALRGMLDALNEHGQQGDLSVIKNAEFVSEELWSKFLKGDLSAEEIACLVEVAGRDALRFLHPAEDWELCGRLAFELGMGAPVPVSVSLSPPLRDVFARLSWALLVLVAAAPLKVVTKVLCLKKIGTCGGKHSLKALKALVRPSSTLHGGRVRHAMLDAILAIERGLSLDIVFASMEARPFCGTGGLGNVLKELPQALAKMGHKVTVILPLHAFIDRRSLLDTGCGGLVQCLDGTLEPFSLWHTCTTHGVDVYFIKNDRFFSHNRDGIYGPRKGGDYEDNAERYDFLSWCIPEALQALGRRCAPDIIQLNDAHTAPAAYYIRLHPAFQNTRIIMAVHNLGAAYQGRFDEAVLKKMHFQKMYYHSDERGPGPAEFNYRVSFLKLGLLVADGAVTVSRRYMEEILDPEMGEGLHGVMRTLHGRGRLWGNLNGIDPYDWDPTTDQKIPYHFSFADLTGKRRCKERLREYYGLSRSVGDIPVFGVVARLAEQKGWDDILRCIDYCMAQPPGKRAQFVLCGQGDPRLAESLRLIARKYPEYVSFDGVFSEEKEHLIYAGSDFFLMPSKFEPCGLPQMYVLRYMTVPVVRGVGGLEESIVEYNAQEHIGNGFKFAPEQSIIPCIERALKWYSQGETARLDLLRNCSLADFSWENASAPEQLAFFRKVINSPRLPLT